MTGDAITVLAIRERLATHEAIVRPRLWTMLESAGRTDDERLRVAAGRAGRAAIDEEKCAGRAMAINWPSG